VVDIPGIKAKMPRSNREKRLQERKNNMWYFLFFSMDCMNIIRICSDPGYGCNYNNKCITLLHITVHITDKYARKLEKKFYLLLSRVVYGLICFEYHRDDYSQTKPKPQKDDVKILLRGCRNVIN
jgi:hypothetical protein